MARIPFFAKPDEAYVEPKHTNGTSLVQLPLKKFKVEIWVSFDVPQKDLAPHLRCP